jgi:hypothetical protein
MGFCRLYETSLFASPVNDQKMPDTRDKKREVCARIGCRNGQY